MPIDSLSTISPSALSSARVRNLDDAPGLTMEPADSTLKAQFNGRFSLLPPPPQPKKQIEKRFPMPADSAYEAKYWKLFTPEMRKLVADHYHTTQAHQGVSGMPIDYELRNDDVVTSVLLLSFVIMAWVIAASWRFLRTSIKDFFYHRTRANLFIDRADTILRGRFFLVLQTSFLQGLLFFGFVQAMLPEVFEGVSPYLLLSLSTLIVLGYYGAKLFLYRCVNHVFFDRESNSAWDNYYLVSILTTGALLLPLTLLVIFFDLAYQEAIIAYILLMAIIKMLLLYKCYRTFFNGAVGYLLIILYFCALEIVPYVLLGGALVSVAYQNATLL